MYLSPPSYCDTSFSASHPLILRLRDLDFLSQVAESRVFFFPPFPHFFSLLTETSQSLSCGGAGGGAQRHWRAALRCPLAPRLAAAALILLSPSSKQRRNEKAVCKLISSTTHYQTHAQNNPQLRLWLLPTWRN